jgi:hypothetical protein
MPPSPDYTCPACGSLAVGLPGSAVAYCPSCCGLETTTLPFPIAIRPVRYIAPPEQPPQSGPSRLVAGAIRDMQRVRSRTEKLLRQQDHVCSRAECLVIENAQLRHRLDLVEAQRDQVRRHADRLTAELRLLKERLQS